MRMKSCIVSNTLEFGLHKSKEESIISSLEGQWCVLSEGKIEMLYDHVDLIKDSGLI
jgi:hypothetical protein